MRHRFVLDDLVLEDLDGCVRLTQHVTSRDRDDHVLLLTTENALAWLLAKLAIISADRAERRQGVAL